MPLGSRSIHIAHKMVRIGLGVDIAVGVPGEIDGDILLEHILDIGFNLRAAED